MFVLRKTVSRIVAKKIIRRLSSRQFSSALGSNILTSRFPDVEIVNASVQDLVFSNADKWGNKIATVSEVSIVTILAVQMFDHGQISSRFN